MPRVANVIVALSVSVPAIYAVVIVQVIVIEPVYDSYAPSIETVGGKVVPVQLKVQRDAQGHVIGYALPWDELAQAITPKTRMIMINSPHNPTGMVWQAQDLDRLADLLRDTSILVCSDEVYEHMVYDNAKHQSVATHPELVQR